MDCFSKLLGTNDSLQSTCMARALSSSNNFFSNTSEPGPQDFTHLAPALLRITS